MKSEPCHDALSAKPGDRIHFTNNGGMQVDEIVKNALWTDAPKGGRIWTYETTEGNLVHNDCVTKVDRALRLQEPDVNGGFSLDAKAVTKQFSESSLKQVLAKQKLWQLVSEAGISPSLFTAIGCVMDGDAANLEVAAFLIGKRIKELQELESASNSPIGDLTAKT